ncbi:MAG: type II glyceraldehyde-3-phosphate dehydrogenase [Candidatus Woesearchaeota archaeon]
MIKVAINGYGTIGRRVADAISLQDDMEVVGVTKTRPSYEALALMENGLFDLYVIGDKKPFIDEGIKVKGTLDDLLGKCDLVIDCSPKKGRENQVIYDKYGLKQIYHGGEKASIAEISFVAQCNYMDAFNKDKVRVVSCNTTGCSRLINAFNENYMVIEAILNLARRTVDPKDSRKGPVNAYIVEVNTHHAPDVLTVIPGINISSNALKGPVTEMHAHIITIDLEEDVGKDEIVSLLDSTPRIRLINSAMGFNSTAEVREFGRIINGSLGGDLYETIVWEDKISVEPWKRRYWRKDQEFTRVTLAQAIHQEADVVPETVDAIRAMFGLMQKEESMLKTDLSLGIRRQKNV